MLDISLPYRGFLEICQYKTSSTNLLAGKLIQAAEKLGLEEAQEKALKRTIKDYVRQEESSFYENLSGFVPREQLVKHGNAFGFQRPPDDENISWTGNCEDKECGCKDVGSLVGGNLLDDNN